MTKSEQSPVPQLLDRAVDMCQSIRDWIHVTMERGAGEETKEQFKERVLWLGHISLEAVKLQQDIREWHDVERLDEKRLDAVKPFMGKRITPRLLKSLRSALMKHMSGDISDVRVMSYEELLNDHREGRDIYLELDWMRLYLALVPKSKAAHRLAELYGKEWADWLERRRKIDQEYLKRKEQDSGKEREG